MSTTPETMVLDFTTQENRIDWTAIDDRIMGGCSQSRPEYIDEIGLRFYGQVSLENNGGFASIRSESGDFDLSRCSGLKIRLRGDGKHYKFSLRTDVFYDGVSYQAQFASEANSWQEIELPFTAFQPTHHGIKLTSVAPIDTSQIKSFGVFIAGKQEGPFQLEIAWIKGL